MATTETPTAASSTRVAWVVLGLLALVAFVVVLIGFRRPPQMGTDEEVFRTVDALYTAVCGHDDKQLGECERRLRAYRDAGKLPKEPAEVLDRVIAKARAGDWETAAERLYDFMLAQRREGTVEPSPQKRDPKGKPAKSKP